MLTSLRHLLVFSISGIALAFNAFSNDGAYFASGNQLVPIVESDIKVTKEILQLKRLSNGRLAVSVYYEFFNPGNEKEVLVGFEAQSPSGDVDATPNNGRHPYMHDFSVDVNGQLLPYDVAIVKDEVYYEHDAFKKLKVEELDLENVNYVDFYYVYHFKATFKKGRNMIKHNYTFDLSNSVMTRYNFDYVLSAAMRWGNQQIDDFTLIIDMGTFQDFMIDRTFFTSAGDWIVSGNGRAIDLSEGMAPFIVQDVTRFAIQNGTIIYQAKNFKPTGELALVSWSYFPKSEVFDPTSASLPFNLEDQQAIPPPKTELAKKILRNLPFARRGYVFRTGELQEFFERQHWYVPNVNYESSIDDLTQLEKDWVEKWSK